MNSFSDFRQPTNMFKKYLRTEEQWKVLDKDFEKSVPIFIESIKMSNNLEQKTEKDQDFQKKFNSQSVPQPEVICILEKSEKNLRNLKTFQSVAS